MKKLLYNSIFIFILVFGYSCEKAEDFLDKKPLGEYSEEDVWSDLSLIETFVNGIYKNALGWPFAIERLSDYVDESHFTPDWSVTNFNKSLMTQDDLQGWSVSWATPQTLHFRWDPLYLNVRRANIFFEKIGEALVDDAQKEELRDRLLGEVYFLRGLTYHYLVAMYGGVPIITTAYALEDNFEVPRNTYEECINFITGQLDSAAMYLPATAGDYSFTDNYDLGRATKGAALALKARILLYAASDLHHKMDDYAPGFAHPEFLGYTTGDQQTRYELARDAAKAVMDMGIYDLFRKNPAPGDSIAQNFVDYFTTKGETSEDILLQCFNTKTTAEGWAHYNPALYCGPNGYHNWGNNCPLGDLVDDYEMRDGTDFDWSNPVHKTNPYANRDQRFYATVLYEGVQWRSRPSDALGIDPHSRIQVGAVYNTDGVTMLKAGLDTRKGPIEDWNGGYTGYYVRKFVDPSFDPQYVAQEVPFRHIRYAEILLNYAEACIELGEEGEALTAINLIRQRAGQPEITETGAALRDKYRHERRIELAYEDHRFWDVRRWVIGPEVYHQTHAISVKYIVDAPNVESYRQPDGSTWGNPIFESIDNPNDARAWNDKCYFFPITRDELGKNPQLIQNPGY
jgi:hypothetical protein